MEANQMPPRQPEVQSNVAAFDGLPAVSSKRPPAIERLLAVFTVLVSGVLLIVISFMVTADVMGRYLFLSPIPGTMELCRLMMPFVTLCAFGYALLQGAHVRVGLVTGRFSARVQKAIDVAVHLLLLVSSAVLTYGFWLLFAESYKINEAMASGTRYDIPIWIAKLGMAIGMALFALVVLYVLVRQIRDLRPGKGR